MTCSATKPVRSRSTFLRESKFLSFLLPTIACLAIADADRKLNCHHRDVGFKPKGYLAFVNLPDILRNVEESKRSRSRNGYHQNEIPLDVAPVWGQ